jgi:penicillin-binding protein 2
MKGFVFSIALLGLLFAGEYAPAQTKKPPSSAKAPTASVRKKASTRKIVKRRVYRPAPPVDPTIGDVIDGDDLAVRRAAVDALGTMNGSVVVSDPSNGRVLTVVNQKLAMTNGFTPCSTIKLVTSLAALNEHVISPSDFVRTGRYARFNLTTALARSNNEYFATLGNRLGFDRVTKYAQMLGLGERAGLNIEGEQPGVIPAEPPKWGGVGLMTSFGEGFQVTPLELAALVSAISNGGTLYYLQYPHSQEDIDQFTPKVKRTLDLAATGFEDMRPGMRGAVDFGTARRASYDPNERIFGKTGTCTDFRASSHMGWFGSYMDGPRPLVVVVMLTGTKTVNGPVAAGVAGAIYKKLSDQSWFASNTPQPADDLPELVTSFPQQ